MRRIFVGTAVISVLVILTSAASNIPARAGSERTLHANELSICWGGEPNDLCCADTNNCFGYGISCGDATSQETCANQVEVQVFAGNKQACITTYPGKTCTEGTSYVCKKIWDCTWETEPPPARCLTTGTTGQFTNPSSCTDDCSS